MLPTIIGIFAGILSGMGVGGGMLLIPALRFFLNMNQQSTQSINLFCFIPSAVCALFVHIKKKNADLKAAAPMIIGGLPFSVLGAYLCVRISSSLLGKLFAVFILVFGIREILCSLRIIKNKHKKSADKSTIG